MRHLRHRCVSEACLIRPRHRDGLGYVFEHQQKCQKIIAANHKILFIVPEIESLNQIVVIGYDYDCSYY